MTSIRRLEQATPAERQALTELILATVNGGASIGFLAPLAPEVAEAYWQGVLASLGPGLVLWVAEHDGRIVGSVQLAPSLRQNGLHRADLMKLMVHPSARGQGVSSRLLREVEQFARSEGRTLLVLDSELGSKAESVYQHHQWQRVGEIPGYAKDTGGVLRSTVVYFKTLSS
ncbi:N-acetyltransferase [Corallococcus sp. CA047B]|uniref:GNAT family N-acetyltransferase n=1 Tax=Corallococcus sp. CA047B TaxID=2316729 RepID=UPI000EA2DB23|nr:GNAT family N-acetyltransferase [Corallococcus sp. CA047B]RKH10368.1 N-acetyltransferase [Corallococcus sp. CA047B]